MKSSGLGSSVLVGVVLLTIGAFAPADAALCMCHPFSCLLINPNTTALSEAELHCPINRFAISDLMIVNYMDKTLSSEAFVSFPNLTSLEVFRGFMVRIVPGAFEKVPKLTKIIIRNNHFDTLEDYTFQGLDELEMLFIIASELATVAPNAFDGLKNLKQLTLAGNRLTQLPGKLFASTPALKAIVLSNNHLNSVLPANLFDGINSLIRLDLSHNLLTAFDFPNLKVTHLALYNNSLTSLYINDHTQTVHAEQNRIEKITGTGANVHNLLLAENAITDITPIARMTNISKLSLSHNPLRPDSVFNNMSLLEELLLSHTGIQIREGTFANLPELKLLDLSYNNLTQVDFSKLSALIELQSLVLAFNRIETINFVEQREYLPKLRVLEICGNGWNTTYLERVLDHMRLYRLRADMNGLSHMSIFKATYVELCATGAEAPKKSSAMDDDYYSEDTSDDIIEQDIAELYPSSSPSTSSTRGTTAWPTSVPHTARMSTPAMHDKSSPFPRPSVHLVTADGMAAASTTVGASPLYITFQVLVYTFSVFGVVSLVLLAYYMRQRRFDVRRVASMDGPDSVRLV